MYFCFDLTKRCFQYPRPDSDMIQKIICQCDVSFDGLDIHSTLSLISQFLPPDSR